MGRRVFRWSVWLSGLTAVLSVGAGVIHYTNRSGGSVVYYTNVTRDQGTATQRLEEPQGKRPAETALSAASGSVLPLDEQQRKFLWEVEHHGLLLGRHGFRALADALVRADAQALRNLLAAD